MLRALIFSVLLSLSGITASYACEGQTGAVIFDDNFADDSGGWDLTAPNSVITPPALVFSIGKTYAMYSAENITFNATDGDYCEEVSLPQPSAPDVNPAAGLIFWATDYANYFSFMIRENAGLGLYKLTASKWTTIFEVANSPAVKTAPDSVNAIRVIAKDGKLTLSVNGTTIKVIRAQVPAGPLKFGAYVECGKLTPNDIAIRLKSYRVVAPPA